MHQLLAQPQQMSLLSFQPLLLRNAWKMAISKAYQATSLSQFHLVLAYLIDIMSKCIDLALLHSQQDHEKFICCICLQFMTKPFAANCQSEAKHLFGIECLIAWVAQKHGQKQCPLCRKAFNKLEVDAELASEASQFEAKCPACQAIHPITHIQAHLSECPPYLAGRREALEKVVEQQICWLQKEINPHLRESHTHIYTTYVQEWQWLRHDTRNWKWWWWCNNPWWENKSCPTCNQLWHKYEKEIDELEARRIELIAELGEGGSIMQKKVEQQGL